MNKQPISTSYVDGKVVGQDYFRDPQVQANVEGAPVQNNIRDGMIHQAQQERMARDTVIMQKVNASHREGFKARFPGQIEHCMRLTAERLQAILTRKPTDLADPATWNCTAEEIRDLTVALDKLAHLNHAYPMEAEHDQHSK